MPKLAPATPAAEATPSPIVPTVEHRAAAKARGSDLDVMLSILHGAIGDVATILREIVSTAPPDDVNIRTLEQKLRLFRGEARLFAPTVGA
jgi:hypothetical protein